MTDTLRPAHRLLLLLLCGCLAAATLAFASGPARADTSSSLTVVGTSDVSDSGLIPNVVQPMFQKAYPQYTFKYIGTATGTAISDAESGSVGASALIVHAASLENQFVANGYSYEQYGRAIFTNDFVLAAPNGDPAGVGTAGAHNITQAFADVAAAGINGGGTPKVTFVSRGGTPGTTVEEHSIWHLVQTSGLAPSGLLLCTVSSTFGGGETPIAAGNGVTASGQACPNGGALPSGGELPAWYATTGLTQGPNVQNANACNGYKSGPNSCYVLTDRGTFDYLSSGIDPAGTIPNLKIVTRGPQPSTAPGGEFALINYFHAYIINPAKPHESINLPAAKDFLNLLTSPAFQSELKNYLAKTSDPGGPPFVADASPIITASGIPRSYHAGRRVTVTGTVTNAEPGYPVLANEPVTIDEIEAGLPVPVASGTTNSSGHYSIQFTPPTNGSYEVATPQIAQIENATLSPVFGDLLSPGASTPMQVTVHSAITKLRAVGEHGRTLVIGSVAPGFGHVRATVAVLARAAGSKGAFKRVTTDRLDPNQGNFAVSVSLAAGGWQIEVKYQDPRQVVAARARKVTVAVGPAQPARVGLRSVKLKGGVLTVAGMVSPARAGTVELLGLNAGAGKGDTFRLLRRASVAPGQVTGTLHATLTRDTPWVLLLEYTARGQAPSFSSLRTVSVH